MVYLFFILEDFATNNLEDAKSFLIITHKGIDPATNLPLISYSPSEGNKGIDLLYYVNQYLLLNKITGYLSICKKLKNYFTPKLNIAIYSIYLISWIYIFYINAATTM